MAGRSPVLQHPHVLLQSLLLLPELLVLGAELLHPSGLPVGDAPGGRRALPGAWAGSCGALRPGDFPVKGTLRGQCLTQHARARTRAPGGFCLVHLSCYRSAARLGHGDTGTRGTARRRTPSLRRVCLLVITDATRPRGTWPAQPREGVHSLSGREVQPWLCRPLEAGHGQAPPRPRPRPRPAEPQLPLACHGWRHPGVSGMK